MVENRKLFYAISLMLLTCCQIITMLPHNVASSESGSISAATTTTATATTAISSHASNNSENQNAKILQETKSNESNNNDKDFLIIATERKQQKQQQQQQQQTIVSSELVWEDQENDSRPTDNIDDLIFLDKRPINQHHQQQQQQQQQKRLLHGSPHHNPQQQLEQQHEEKLRNEQKHFEFQHMTMNGGGSNSNSNNNEGDTDSLTDTTDSSLIVAVDDDEDVAANDDDADADDDGAPHEIELQPDINEEVTPFNATPLDLSDFLSLIPATKVKTIVNRYYHNDPEVQRAHAFMSSRDFLMLKQHIIAVPEMSAFLHYLNNSGLDLVKFVTALTNLTSYKSANTATANTPSIAQPSEGGSVKLQPPHLEQTTIAKQAEANDIVQAEKQQNNQILAATTLSDIEIQTATNMPNMATAAAAADEVETTTTAREQLNGLHGLVDSVLDVLPQDQMLATFFDKLEANEQFSKLVDNIGSPEFAKILNNMQNSMPLRNLIFTLHNNGIYIIRIVDSLKSYFFLGGF